MTYKRICGGCLTRSGSDRFIRQEGTLKGMDYDKRMTHLDANTGGGGDWTDDAAVATAVETAREGLLASAAVRTVPSNNGAVRLADPDFNPTDQTTTSWLCAVLFGLPTKLPRQH